MYVSCMFHGTSTGKQLSSSTTSKTPVAKLVRFLNFGGFPQIYHFLDMYQLLLLIEFLVTFFAVHALTVIVYFCSNNE